MSNIRDLDPTRTALRHYVQFCATYFGFTPHGFIGRARHNTLAKPRKLAMAAIAARLVKHPTASLVQIGQAFGRDHGTVIHARRMLESQHEPEWQENENNARKLAEEWKDYYANLISDPDKTARIAHNIRSRILQCALGKATEVVLVCENGTRHALGSKNERELMLDIEAALAVGTLEEAPAGDLCSAGF